MHNVISANSPRINEPSSWLTRIISAGRVTAGDISALRNEIFPMGLMSRQDGEALFAIDHIVLDKAQGWMELVVELVTDLVVWGERPTGTISQLQAEWIIAQVDAAPSGAALATLAALADEAKVVPSWFMAVVRRRLAADWRRIGFSDTQRAAA